MVIPRGKVVYKNLNSSFTNFAELLLNLNATEFTGYVRMNFVEYDGIIYFINGKIINAVSETADDRRLGQEALNRITTKAKEKDGTINVHELSAKIVKLLSNLGKRELVYKDLSSDFSMLDGLIKKLEVEQHTGYIEISTEDEKMMAVIFLRRGELVESVISTKDKATAETGKLQEIIDIVSNTRATFNVYKAAVSTSNPNINITTTFEIKQLLNVWAAIIGVVEQQVSRDRFDTVFREAQIDKAKEYPFLDPFAEEFIYKNGQITFEGNFTKNFNKGLTEALKSTIKNLEINSLLKTQFESIRKQFANTFNKYSMNEILTELTNV